MTLYLCFDVLHLDLTENRRLDTKLDFEVKDLTWDLITLTTSLFPFSVFSSVFHIWIQSVRDLFREISNILIHNILIVILFLSDNKLC